MSMEKNIPVLENTLSPETYALLQRLTNTFGPSGCEEAVAKCICETVAPYADEVKTDRMGNVIVLYRGIEDVTDGEKVMLSAHMDEPGFMVNDIDGSGYLHLTELSLRDGRMLSARRIRIGNETGYHPAFLGAKPAHKHGGAVSFGELYADLGATSKEDAEAYAAIGDFGTFATEFAPFGDHYLSGKAFGGRLGCAILCELLRTLSESGERLPYDLYLTFTCRGEILRSSIGNAAFSIRPECAILVEGTIAADIPGVPEDKQASVLDGGPVIAFQDNGAAYDRGLYDFLIALAAERAISCQYKRYAPSVSGVTRIVPIGEGIRTASISLPIRGLPSETNIASIRDYLATRDLLLAMLHAMD